VRRSTAQRGFTLIEMMIVVAIIAILASIALPRFEQYGLRARSAEAKSMFGGIVACEEAFGATYEAYAPITQPQPATVPGGNKAPWNVSVCPANCSRTNPAACTSFDCIGFASPSAVYYQYAVGTRPPARGVPPEFGVGARGDLDSDGAFGSYGYRTGNSGTGQGVVVDPVSACPANIAARVLENCNPIDW
jgi:prepilin-type N-terminal cleavage/methylation domain-containing protein